MGGAAGIDIPSAAALGAYMLALVAIGLWASRQAGANEAEFLLGGRNLGPVIAGLAYAATTSSAWVLLGFTAFVANVGVAALWMVPGILAGYAVVWLWLGAWLNEAARRAGHLTALDVLASDVSGPAAATIRFVAALMIVFCFAFYIAAQFDAAGAALARVFGIGKTEAILLGAAVILAYTLLGGFLAVSLTDTLQGLSILVVAVVLPAAALASAGGVEGLRDAIAGQPEAFRAPFGAHAGWSALGFAAGLAATGFGALGQPHLLTWVMAARDRAARVQGAAVAIVWGALVYGGMSLLALAARAGAAPGAALGESIIFDVASALLPGLASALVTAAILSAIMSTVDAQLLTASAVSSRDLRLARLARGREVLATRGIIFVLCVAAVTVTLAVPATIFSRVLFAWTALGAAFGPTFVALAAGRRPSGAAILMAMIAGFGLAVWFNQFAPSGPGQWKERIIPWLAGFAIVFAFSSKGHQNAHGGPT